MGTNEEYVESLIVTDELLVRYLLGDLQEPDRIRIQEKSFSDDELFERLVEAENDLIDRYARGELAGRERELFEKAVLQRESTRQRLTFANALGAATARGQQASAGGRLRVPTRPHFPSRGKTAWYQLAAAAALLLMVGVVVWLMLHVKRSLPEQAAQNRSPAEQQTPAAAPRLNPAAGSNNDADRPPTTPKPGSDVGDRRGAEPEASRALLPTVAAFALSPGSTRSGEQPQMLAIKSGTRQVKLHLQLDDADEYDSYGVVLRNARGNEIWKTSRLVASRFAFGKAVTVEVTARNLAPGQYELELTGRQGAVPPTIVNYYYFTIAKSGPM